MSNTKKRKLQAILFADIVGYTSLMQKNKTNSRIHFLFLISILIYTACSPQPAPSIELTQQKPSSKKQNYIITFEGDSIPTGVPIPTKGIWINPDSFAQPKTIPITFKPNIKPVNANVHPVGKPEIVPIPKKLTTITPGKNGVPLPKTIVGKGTIYPALQTKAHPSSSPKMKETTISNIQYWDIEEGLNHSIIRSLLEDRRGHLWIGSRGGGISRFDGNHFWHFTAQEGLKVNALEMLEDKKGNIWIGAQNGLVSYDGANFIHYQSKNGLNHNLVRCFIEDKKGDLWIGTQGNGISRFTPNEDGKSGQFKQYTTETGLSDRRVYAIMQDSKGDIWMGTLNGLIRFDGEKFTHYTTEEGLSNRIVNFIIEDKNGFLWIGTNNGLNRFDGENFYQYSKKQGLTGNYIWTLFEDSQGYLWVGTFDGGGLMKFKPDENGHIENFTHYDISNGLNDNNINRIFEDSDHHIWVGMGIGGVNRIDKKALTHHSARFISSIMEDKAGRLWMSAREEGLLRMDSGKFAHIGLKEGLPYNHRIRKIITDSQDNLWLIKPGRQGAYRIEWEENSWSGKMTNFSQKEGLGFGLKSMAEDNNGNFWFSSSNGIFRYDGKNFTHFDLTVGLSSNVGLNLFGDSQGNIWISMEERGVTRFQPDDGGTTGILTHFTTAEGLSHNSVEHIFEDSRGSIWLGTRGGLNFFDGNQFFHLTAKDGLCHNHILAIAEDKQHNIWVSTYKGISLLTPKTSSSDSIQTSLLEKYTIRNFGKEDGFNDIRFMSGSVAIDSKNNIWWGHYSGATKLDLDKFKFSDTPPKLSLQSIDVEGAFVDYRQLKNADYRNSFPFGEVLNQAFDSVALFENYPLNLTLPYDLNHLTFRFTGIDWTAPHKIQYSYKIEGLDQTWSSPNKEPIADYRNLPYGDFTLKIKARGEAKVWSELFEYPFTIRPPWWHTWWARLLYVLLGSSLIYALFRLRTFNLRAQQKQLENTVTERTAEVVEQQKRSDELLLNILPAKVAEELKTTGQVQPILFEEVSILFADFQEFTNIVASIPGKKLVQELNEMFQHFDDIMEDLGIEKIQTIGDAYVAACGLPQKDSDHAIKCVKAAQQMLAYLDKRNQESAIKWKIRIGIHSGAITAGVVGKRKFTYDLFGDTINIAARIESSSEEGKINVSAYTYDLIKAQFECEYRGKIDAKGKGNLDMYFVK